MGSCTNVQPRVVAGNGDHARPLIEENLEEEALPIIPDNPEHAAHLKELLTLPVFGKNPPIVEDPSRADDSLFQCANPSFKSIRESAGCERSWHFHIVDGGDDLASEDPDRVFGYVEGERTSCVGVIGALLCVAWTA